MASPKAVRVIESEFEEQLIAPLISELLRYLGEDPRRDGLIRTPERVDKALRFRRAATVKTSIESLTARCSTSSTMQW